MDYSLEQNQLLHGLALGLQQQLLAEGEWVSLVVTASPIPLHEGPLSVYFPVAGVIALMMQSPGEKATAITLVSDAGMLGVSPLLCGLAAPYTGWVIVAGHALRVTRHTLEVLQGTYPSLARRLARYMAWHEAQLAQAVVCHGAHSVTQRLASLLLHLRNGCHHSRFAITQSTLATLLGVRRVGVTVAAQAMQRQAMIHYRRGQLTIVNIPALRHLACQCHVLDRAQQQRCMSSA